MQELVLQDNIVLLKLSSGEELISQLSTYCLENNISGGTFSVIGAAKSSKLSFYNLPKKVYEDHEFNEEVEILSVTGNIAAMDGKIIIHAHGVFGKQSLNTFGGHIKELAISATGEITLWKLPNLQRSFDETTGLNLLNKSDTV